MSVRAIIPRQRLLCPLTRSPKLHRRFSTSPPHPAAKLSIHPTPSPPRLPPSEQAIFEDLVQRSSVAGPFSTPPPSTQQQQQQQARRDPRARPSAEPHTTETPPAPPQSRYTADTPPRSQISGTPSRASSRSAPARPATTPSSTPSSSSSSSGSPGPEPGRPAPRSPDPRADTPVVVEISASSDTTGSGAVTPLHPDVRRGAPPEFDGERNPKTGELGGPKNEPLRWGSGGDWSYNGRVTDF